MKNLIFNLTLVLITILLICQSVSFADNECPMSEWYPNMSVPPNFIGGYYKPHRTDSAEGQALPLTASMNAIIVFVQFPDEDPLTNNSEWPIGQPPIYKDNLLSSVRKNSGAFWTRYDETTERLSDYYQEVSRGKFHMTGITRHYIFNHNRSWYNTTTMNNEVYTKLQTDTAIHFIDYDRWQYLSAGNYRYQGDGNLDMLMMVRRTNAGHAGFAGLDGSDFEIDPVNHIWVRRSFTSNGSGTVVQGNLGTPPQPHPYNRFLGILIHEYGHYLFTWDHSTIGLMTSRGGNSINDLYYSPFEKVKLGYLNSKAVDYNNSIYSIGDVSSRTSNDNILQVPISSNEYFLIENRRKISKYDVKMIGDTAQTDMFRNILEYGKGVYIYHHRSIDMNYPGDQDEECADGIWNWTVLGTTTPDWSITQPVQLLVRTSLPYTANNDNGIWDSLNNSNKDGISAYSVYFSQGGRHADLGLAGINKLYTNFEQYWTSRELWGDRMDAWNIGYNEIFSPYSNPNTKELNNNYTGIFIYYQSLSSGIADLKVYKATDAATENVILAATPPSRPMGLRVEEYYPPGSTSCYPKLVWNHNLEPDMIRTSKVKKYKLYIATGPTMNTIPSYYGVLANQEIHKDSVPYFIDFSVRKYGCALLGLPTGEKYPVRYYVKAVDKYDDESVPSDFVQTIGITGPIDAEPEEDSFESNIIPKKYNISQNYPNPFNPVTKIKYELPLDGNVSIKIFDINGRLILNLVNESKTAGSYELEFNGENLSSGIYYYKIESGNFTQVRKMILLK